MKKKIIRISTVSRSLDKLLGSQIDYIKDFYDIVLVSQNDDKGLVKLGKEKDLPIFPVNLSRKISPLRDFFALIKLTFFLLKEKPEIVHTHTPKAGLIGMIAAKISGVPNRLHTVAGMPLLEKKGYLFEILIIAEKITYLCANNVYFNSKGLMNYVFDNKIALKSKKFKVIGYGSTNGVDVERFNKNNVSKKLINKLKASYNIKDNDFVFLFIGRLVKDKGVNELISAFKKLALDFQDVKLLILGRFEQDLDPVEMSTIEEIKNNDNIIFAGYKHDVVPYFAIANAFVFPSYREGFPNVVLQAGAMGLPSIVSDINGNNEIIINNFNGVIVKVKNIDAIYNEMKRWLKESKNVMIMAGNSRKVIVNKFSQKFVSKEVLKEYNTILI